MSDGSPLRPYWGPAVQNGHEIFENHVADHVHKGLKGKGLEVHSAVEAFTDEIEPQPAYRPEAKPSKQIKHLANKELNVLASADLPPAWISALVENPAAQNPSEKYLEVILDKPVETPKSVTFFSGSKQSVQKETQTIVSTGEAVHHGLGNHGHGVEIGNPSPHDRFVPPEILLAEGSHWKTNGHLEHEKNQHYSGEVVPAQEG